MFTPENDLERAMQQAVRDTTKIADFYRTLLESEIYILTPEAKMEPGRRRSLKYLEPLHVATVEFQGLRWHPAFTSKKRISAYVKEPETCFGAVAKNMLPMLAGSNFWFNPLSECQKPMPASEVALLLSGEIFDALNKAT
ncbi:SseB family protein [Lichenifustis flavocetrariae]|uniref:SseB family protein n=1 Tax=Lichenifustis flavocetrariae TaxID=2949735 RepID=A0AA42CMY5_9HYPH|nr:SseB family protein [Lichenifustis flavocetrariae]MCW6508867.1 SseB family protein [Lichenifustis flavocetrariae]